jgi:hypothetical protein
LHLVGFSFMNYTLTITQSVPLIAAPRSTTSSRGKPASAGTCSSSCDAQDNSKRNTLLTGSNTANDVCFISILKCRTPVINTFSFVQCSPNRQKHADKRQSCSDRCLVTVTLVYKPTTCSNTINLILQRTDWAVHLTTTVRALYSSPIRVTRFGVTFGVPLWGLPTLKNSKILRHMKMEMENKIWYQIFEVHLYYISNTYYQYVATCFFLLLIIAPTCFGHSSRPSSVN